MIPSYYINLARSTDRRAFMTSTYDNIIRVPAYDGQKLSQYDDLELPQFNTCVTSAQIACTLSHIKAITTAYNNGDDGAFIFEDDMSDKYKHKWKHSLEYIVRNTPTNYECVVMFCSNIIKIQQLLQNTNNYTQWRDGRFGTGCYYIKRSGMEKIVNRFVKNGKISVCNRRTFGGYSLIADRGILFKNMVTCSYTRPTMIGQQFKSTISGQVGAEKDTTHFLVDYFSSN